MKSTSGQRLLGFATLLLAVSPVLHAADVTARIRGTVSDPVGAVIPGASVTATNAETGVTFPTKTQPDGTYEFLHLPLGTYSITVVSPGFATFNASGIRLDIDTNYVEPVKLSVGATQEISVKADAVQVDSTNMQLNNVVEAKQIVELPLITRDFTQLEQLLPGVQASSDRFGSYSANGSQTQQSSFLLNGSDSNDLPLNGISFRPSVDALSEFNLITSSLNPEYSRNSGAIVSATFKTGTNQFHGDAFEFYRDTFLNTKSYFQNSAAVFHQNLFGGTLGGPIIKDKLFFFLSYQGNRTSEPQAVNVNTVYSPQQLAGNFSSLTGNTSFTTHKVPGSILPQCTGLTYAQCFPNGEVPTADYNTVAAALTKQYVPLPNAAGSTFLFNPTTTLVQDQGIGRIDYNPTAKDQIWGVFVFQHAPSSDTLPFTGATLPGFGDVNTSEIHQFAVSYTRQLSSSALNEFSVHYTRFNYGAVSPQQVVQPSSAGFDIVSQNPAVAGLPKIQVGSNFTLGFSNNGPQPRKDQTYQVDDNFSKVVGRHALKFGYDGRRFNVDNPFYGSNNGTFAFTNSNTAGTGSALLDFLIGVPNTYNQGTGGRIDAYAYEHYLYVQDQWKATDSLNITYGVGYQIDTAFHNRQFGGEGVTCFIPGQQSVIFPTAPEDLNYPGDKGCNDASGAVSAFKDVGPRFGFAYSPQLGFLSGGQSHKLSIRGGYGIYYNRSEEETSLNNLGDPPFGLNSNGAVDYGATKPSFVNPYQDLATGAVYANKFPATIARPGQAVDFGQYEPLSLSQYAANFRVPYSQNFQVSIEREFPSQIIARMSYVGSLGRHEQVTIEGNPVTQAGHDACLADPACFGNPDTQSLSFPTHSVNGNSDIFPSVGLISTEGTSNYNSLQLSMNKALTHGLILQASYTLSHALDDASNYENAGYGGTTRGYNQYQPSLNYGNSTYDARNRFIFSPVYVVPRFLSGGYFANLLGSGWEISGIETLANGFPYDISYGGEVSYSLYCSAATSFYACPDVPVQTAPLQRLTPRNKAAAVNGNPSWFGTAGFTDEAIGTFGNIGRDTYHGPGLNNTDVEVSKNFYYSRSSESKFIQLRLESYNVFNHTQFSNPDGNYSDNGATFGTITSVQHAPRQTQLVGKFYF